MLPCIFKSLLSGPSFDYLNQAQIIQYGKIDINKEPSWLDLIDLSSDALRKKMIEVRKTSKLWVFPINSGKSHEKEINTLNNNWCLQLA